MMWFICTLKNASDLYYPLFLFLQFNLKNRIYYRKIHIVKEAAKKQCVKCMVLIRVNVLITRHPFHCNPTLC
jgi:hypothetical protein